MKLCICRSGGKVAEWALVGSGSCMLPRTASLAGWPIIPSQLSLGAAISQTRQPTQLSQLETEALT